LSDHYAAEDYRKHLAEVYAKRALTVVAGWFDWRIFIANTGGGGEYSSPFFCFYINLRKTSKRLSQNDGLLGRGLSENGKR
jgi:hypothetical protein